MKKPNLNTRFSKIRFKLFATIISVLTVFFIIMTAVTSPALFYVLSSQTYKQQVSAAEQIKTFIPGTVTYYFDLYAVSVNNNIDFEILNPDGTIYYTSSGDSIQGVSHFSSSSSSASEYSNTVRSDDYRYTAKYDGFEVRKLIAADAKFFVYTTYLETGETLHIYSSVADVEKIVDVCGSVFLTLFMTLFIFFSLIFYFLVAKFTKQEYHYN